MAEEIQLLVDMAGEDVANRAEAFCEPRLAAQQAQHLVVHLGAAGTSLDVEAHVDAAPLRFKQCSGQIDIAEIIGDPMDFPAFRDGIDARAQHAGQCSCRPVGPAEKDVRQTRSFPIPGRALVLDGWPFTARIPSNYLPYRNSVERFLFIRLSITSNSAGLK